MSRFLTGLILLGLGAWVAAAGTPIKTQVPFSHDEQILKQAGLPIDNPGLLDYFRRQTPTQEQQTLFKQRIAQLSSSAYPARVKATEELIQAGRASLPWLRQTVKSKDTEAVRRAQHCIRIIEQSSSLALAATASRILADRKVPGSLEVLLAYLPFIDEVWVEEEVRHSLKRLAFNEGKVSALVEASLDDGDAKRRAAAVWIVGQSADPRQRQRLVQRLRDESGEVRFLAASALLSAREPAAVPTLIALLNTESPELATGAEELLFRLAGESGPAVWLNTANDNNGQKVRAAWESWWTTNESRIDWKTIRLEEQTLGLTLVVENQRPDGAGRIYECSSTGQIRWQVRMQNPIEAHWLPGGRILVGDSRASQIYEMDSRGTIHWKHTGIAPTSCQRLPNGNTVVSTYQNILELSREGKIVFNYPTQGHTYHARKLPNDHYVWIDASGDISEINAKGALIGKTNVGTGLTWGSIERLRNGHYLVALGGINKVQEIDLAGKVYWEKTVNNPNRAVRLANGHVLVASHGDQCVYEFDNQGNQRWKHPCVGRPFTAQRR